MKYRLVISLAFATLLPLVAAAQGRFNITVTVLTASINLLIIFLFLVATVVFLWGVVKYISAGGDEAKTEEARNMIIWGIIFLAVMVAVWGFVYVLLDFVFATQNPFPIPGVGDVPKQ